MTKPAVLPWAKYLAHAIGRYTESEGGDSAETQNARRALFDVYEEWVDAGRPPSDPVFGHSEDGRRVFMFWGSECIRCGNTTPGTNPGRMRCDECKTDTYTAPLYIRRNDLRVGDDELDRSERAGTHGR